MATKIEKRAMRIMIKYIDEILDDKLCVTNDSKHKIDAIRNGLEIMIRDKLKQKIKAGDVKSG